MEIKHHRGLGNAELGDHRNVLFQLSPALESWVSGRWNVIACGQAYTARHSDTHNQRHDNTDVRLLHLETHSGGQPFSDHLVNLPVLHIATICSKN